MDASSWSHRRFVSGSAASFLLGTRDAHALYAKLGFAEPPPGVLMGKQNPNADFEPGAQNLT